MRKLIIAIILLVGGFQIIRAVADYQATVGSGTTFASKIISTANYAAHLLCDATAGETQCAAVSAAGAVKVDGSAVTQPVSGNVGITGTPTISGTVTANLGTIGTAATAANQATEISSLATIATNTGAAIPLGNNRIGYTSDDPCSNLIKSGGVVNFSTTAGQQVIAGTAAKKTFICSIDLISSAANNVALVEGTGTVCATSTAGVAGGATAATGWNFAANGGLTKGSGAGTVYLTATTANNVCLLSSAAGQVSGQITYVQQ